MTTVLFISVTIATELSMGPNMKLIDINGIPHSLTPGQVRVMIAIGWISFLLGWAFNTIFYQVMSFIRRGNTKLFSAFSYIRLLWTSARRGSGIGAMFT